MHAQIHTQPIQYLNLVACDQAIQTILRSLKPNLKWIIDKTYNNIVVLGCTEFSVFCYRLGFQWIDPIHLDALDMVGKFTRVTFRHHVY